MAKPTPEKIPPKAKPEKPRPDFPLFAHASGQWAKKINQKMHYFGTWDDPDGAFQRYLDQRDDILGGRQVRSRGGLTVRELVNHFLNSKRRLVQSGELSERTWESCHRRMVTVLDVFGKGRHVDTLTPQDFEKLRGEFAKTHGPVTLCNDISVVRSLFLYAYEAELIPMPVRLGPGFKPPSRATLRKARKEKGKRMFEAGQIRDIIQASGVQLRAMTYLGINCGLGNHDCAMLRQHQITNGWLEYPRPKTGIDRRCPLWPETIEALEAVAAKRPTPKNAENADRVFVTKYGYTWEPKTTTDSPISKEFAKVIKALGIHRDGLGFYALRHTFQTIGERSRDKDAVKAIMGHVEDANDMSAVYNEEGPDDSRLKAVTEYVRTWLKNTQ